MKLDISETIKDYDGKDVTDETYQVLTVRRLLRMYAGSYVPAQGPKAAEKSVIANAIALKIHAANGEMELTGEEFKVLKDVIATPRHGAMIYCQIHAAVNAPGEEIRT